MKALIFSAALAASCAPAFAQSNCGPSGDVERVLVDTFQEEAHVLGLSRNGYVLTFWGNSETGTWTIIARSAQGTSCVFDAGEGFQRVDLKAQL